VWLELDYLSILSREMQIESITQTSSYRQRILEGEDIVTCQEWNARDHF
jgi:hypothetical protein